MTIAIRKNEYDLLRIIPFNETDSRCDFKIAMLDNNYTLRMKQLNTEYFLNLETNINDYEITYHSKQGSQPTKLHFKNTKSDEDYKTLPLSNLEDPIISEDFPFPLLKLGVEIDGIFKRYKKRAKHSVLDLENNNVLELFIVSSNFDFEYFFHNWGLFAHLITILPLEYYTNGKIDTTSTKVNQIINPNKNFNMEQVNFNVSDNLAIIGSCQRDPNIDGIKQKSYIQFYDNNLYLKYLACIPVQFRLADGSKTIKQKAYKWQLTSIKNNISKEKFHYYQGLFTKWDKEIKRDNIKLHGVILQA